MFEFAGVWELPINLLFLVATGYIALRGIRYRDEEGETDIVQLVFGCIAGVFFMLVLLQDVLGVVSFY